MSNSKETLYLGYDASCIDCSNIARSIRREAGRHIEVISLRSQQMREWRQDALGDEAPWAPTLVRVADGKVQAWTGWQIAPVLARHLDTRTTWRILGALGGNALSGTKTANSRINRSAFLRGAVGSFVGLGVLMKAGSAAATTKPSASASDAEAEDVERLSGSRLMDAAQRALATADLTNVAEPRSLVSPNAIAPASTDQIPSASLREADQVTGQDAPPAGELEVYGVEIDRGDGIVETGIVLYQHEQDLLVHIRMLNEPLDGVLTQAHRIHVDHGTTEEHPELSTISYSVNGAVPRAPQEGDLETLANDPCGGCNLSCGPGNSCGEEHLTSQCNWEATWQCVLGLGGCALCTACSGWFTCIGCAITACPTAVDACCTSASEVCARCVYPT
ncbi:hypothetical protein [Nocardiopsis sp. MG754419]|uniref:hypothetical protein n=1 Tax=Nocardiopsis sp. MG754419 TaxID=2259865 RepID=UPI001BA4BFE4|nr:hypothetical protein [Nocardiopsis sp. MG754419]MBR8742629.1 hypothetical protein [Nocardiopsis sp. MG754419]